MDEFFDHSNILSSLAYIDSHLPVMAITGPTDLDQRLGQISTALLPSSASLLIE